MKQHTLLLALTFFVVSTQAHAIFRLGLQGGLSMGNVSSDPAVTTDNYNSLAGGALVELGLGGHLKLQPEVMYVSKGYAITAIDAKVKFNYIEVPVFLKYTFGTVIHPYFFAGPYFSTKVGFTTEVAGVSADATGLKSTDFGVAGGAGLEFSLPGIGFFASGRYDLGLTNLDETATTTVKNKAIIVMGGIIFGM